MVTQTKEVLQEIAMRKNKRGCATREALQAQKMMYERANSFANYQNMTKDISRALGVSKSSICQYLEEKKVR